MNYKSLNDAFINNRPELDYMAYLCFEFEPKWLDEYKKYIEDKEAGCLLNKDQFQELYNKWDLIHNCGSLMRLYREVSLIEGISEKDVEDALKLKKDEFELKLNSEKKKRKAGYVYNPCRHQGNSWNMV